MTHLHQGRWQRLRPALTIASRRVACAEPPTATCPARCRWSSSTRRRLPRRRDRRGGDARQVESVNTRWGNLIAIVARRFPPARSAEIAGIARPGSGGSARQHARPASAKVNSWRSDQVLPSTARRRTTSRRSPARRPRSWPPRAGSEPSLRDADRWPECGALSVRAWGPSGIRNGLPIRDEHPPTCRSEKDLGKPQPGIWPGGFLSTLRCCSHWKGEASGAT